MIRITAVFLVVVLVTCAAFAAEEVILRVGMQDEPITLNPFYARDVWSWNVLGLIYESLYGYNPELELIPMLAGGDPEIDAENGTAVVRLKEGITWSDGTALTAQDVAFTAQVIQHFQFPTLYYRFEFVKDVEVVDEHTLCYHLDTEALGAGMTPIFETDTLTNFVVQKKQWKSIFEDALKQRDPLNWFVAQMPEPVGCGPFKYDEWLRGSYIYLAKNEHYYASDTQVDGQTVGPFVDGVLFNVYRTTDLASLALKKDDLDYIFWSIPPGFIEDLEKDPDITVHRNPSNGFFYLAFNLRNAPWDDVALRTALSTLIDRETIVERILWNLGEPLYTVVPPGNEYWHNPEVQTLGKGLSTTKRLDEAKTILSEAGYTWENGDLILPDGSLAPALEILVPPADYDPVRDKAAGLVTVWFNQLGLKVRKRNISFAELVFTVFDERDFEAYVLGWGLSPDPDYVRVFFHSKYDVPGGFNSTGYQNPEFDELAQQSMITGDPEKRREIIFTLQKMLAEDLPYLTLYSLEIIEAHANRFTGWVDQLGGIGNHWSFVFAKPVK